MTKIIDVTAGVVRPTNVSVWYNQVGNMQDRVPGARIEACVCPVGTIGRTARGRGAVCVDPGVVSGDCRAHGQCIPTRKEMVIP